jgi:hypothetical protein
MANNKSEILVTTASLLIVLLFFVVCGGLIWLGLHLIHIHQEVGGWISLLVGSYLLLHWICNTIYRAGYIAALRGDK